MLSMRSLLTFTLLLGLVAPATAIRPCGDDVDGKGKHVACACGDLLVSSHVLGPADEVTTASCPSNGLLVAAAGPVTLDLDGRTIAGNGQGVGILVVRGSLLLVGPGSVEHFGIGVVANGTQALRSAVNVRVAENRLDGLLARGAGFTVVGSVAEGNGRNGFALDGVDYALDGNRASRNGRHGFKLTGMGTHVGGGFGNEAVGNAGVGFWLQGGMHQVVGATASGNGKHGVMATVAHTMFSGVHADANLGNGLWAMGPAISVANSTAVGNQALGIWVMGKGVVDGGGNHGEDNRGVMADYGKQSQMMAGMAPLIQCRIGMMGECR